MSKPKRRSFSVSNLIRIAMSEDFQDEREPLLHIGDIVHLNSGGPAMLVVDIINGQLTAAWNSGGDEMTAAPICFHRVRDEW